MDTTLPNTNGDDQDQGAGGLIVPVQLDSLKLGGVPPQAGDTVKFTVEGTVDHVDEQDGLAYVKPEKINGQDIPDADDSDQGPSEDDLQAKAEQADQESYGQ